MILFQNFLYKSIFTEGKLTVSFGKSQKTEFELQAEFLSEPVKIFFYDLAAENDESSHQDVFDDIIVHSRAEIFEQKMAKNLKNKKT